MPQMVIRIAEAGTPVRSFNKETHTYEIKPSVAGHMWFEVQGSKVSKNNFSAGFAPKVTGIMGNGEIVASDKTSYGSAYYTVTFNISEKQAQQLYNFKSNPQGHGFDLYYHYNVNTCIDFVYKALNVIGLNKNYNNQILNRSQGDHIPYNNVDNLFKLLTGQKVVIQEKLAKAVYHRDTPSANPFSTLLDTVIPTKITHGKFNTILNPQIQSASASYNMVQASTHQSIDMAGKLMLEQSMLASNSREASFDAQLNRMLEAMASFGSENGVTVDNLTNQTNVQNTPQLVASVI